MTTDPFAASAHDRATWLLMPIGLATVLAALAAQIVAGGSLADTFVTNSGPAEMARDRGVAAATTAWATPLPSSASPVPTSMTWAEPRLWPTSPERSRSSGWGSFSVASSCTW